MIDLREYCRQHGLKQGWVARQAGISDSLLRYYMDRGELPEQVEASIREVLQKNAKEISKLKENQRAFK